MEQELKNALKLISEKCKEPNYHVEMKKKPLSQRIQSLNGQFLHYVDNETIWYCHGVRIKKNPNDPFREHPDYKLVELSDRERKKSIEELERLIRDAKACINHLEDK